jgi:hypothetical protein
MKNVRVVWSPIAGAVKQVFSIRPGFGRSIYFIEWKPPGLGLAYPGKSFSLAFRNV